MNDPSEEEKQRRMAHERLMEAARRVGLSLERLQRGLSQVARNEAETRRFLAENVYGVSDAQLDELVRQRLARIPPNE